MSINSQIWVIWVQPLEIWLTLSAVQHCKIALASILIFTASDQLNSLKEKQKFKVAQSSRLSLRKISDNNSISKNNLGPFTIKEKYFIDQSYITFSEACKIKWKLSLMLWQLRNKPFMSAFYILYTYIYIFSLWKQEDFINCSHKGKELSY